MKATTAKAARPDEDVAKDIVHAFKFDNDVPDERIKVHVKKGIVTLEGNVDSALQKHTAEADAEKVRGVLGVKNQILVEPAIVGRIQR